MSLPQYICEICRRVYKHQRSLNDHIRYDHNGDDIKCNKCGKSFQGRKNYKQHKCHNRKKCDTCGKVFAAQSLYHHARVCKGRPYTRLLRPRRVPIHSYTIQECLEFELMIHAGQVIPIHENRNVQDRLDRDAQALLYVDNIDGKDKGVRAKVPIGAGVRLPMAFSGTIVDEVVDEYVIGFSGLRLWRNPKKRKSKVMVQARGLAGRMNHCSRQEANIKVMDDGAIVTRRAITMDEELVYDYGKRYVAALLCKHADAVATVLNNRMQDKVLTMALFHGIVPNDSDDEE